MFLAWPGKQDCDEVGAGSCNSMEEGRCEKSQSVKAATPMEKVIEATMRRKVSLRICFFIHLRNPDPDLMFYCPDSCFFNKQYIGPVPVQRTSSITVTH